MQAMKDAATCPVSSPKQHSSRCVVNHSHAQSFNQSKEQLKHRGEGVNKLVEMSPDHQVAHPSGFSYQQIDILKNSICKGATDEEFQIFLMACKQTQLDPFMKQIYAVKRWDSRLKRETMTIQTGIDGYRLMAERTEKYAPGPKPTFTYDQNGGLLSATAYVKKMTKDGTWHIVEAEAYLDEYCQRDKEGKCTGMWRNMQRNQLAKCAESLALRKAFPAEISGVYTKEEMSQADIEVYPSKAPSFSAKITQDQAENLKLILDECDEKYRQWVFDHLKNQYKVVDLKDVPADIYERMKAAAMKNMQDNFNRQKQEIVHEQELNEEIAL
jgi:phage recombination protein Bet